ncbi:PLP-dependent aminotransferase family protein [Diaphorobacter sp. HDW4B]|uniref:MocR-like pyridoxine biosynthesis transcription factor PdxR n=1 Tax=Diaphorobacter sp. HDW4B TaxID=2714925 RepID=UPI0014073F6E|nr:PLP-dependent aminotransferase family protein [Diaphorobacter sp. HDW4B]QIL72985.1 PLP-dependent aminotransferase family protein [Diaphorobacter sp. HDW4B]
MPPEELLADPLIALLTKSPLSRQPSADSLQRQLQQHIRSAILNGRLPSDTRLPGSRTLALALGISRNSVTAAYELLGAEGFIHLSRQGTTVAALAKTQASTSKTARAKNDKALPAIARRAAHIRDNGMSASESLAFRPGVPALSRFPLTLWKRCLDKAIQQAGVNALGYGHPLGEQALRVAIANHLAVARGVRCEPEQVVITEGAQEALTLCMRLVANPGDTAWVEDPGYRGAQTAMACGDLKIVPMRVDQDGICAPEAAWKTHPPRVIYTTPSHQYPLGSVLSAARRLDLIAKAEQHSAWIIEDDYDSEFRHSGEPIGAMQGLVPHAPVLYAGTFSKTLFPALRLGFLVLPEALLQRAQVLLRETLRGGHRFEQLALAEFIASGQFTRHLGRMRRLYRSRQSVLREAIATHFSKIPHRISGGDSGMHLTVQLPHEYCDSTICDAARAYDMAPAPLSRFALKPTSDDNGLVLGYGNTSESRIPTLVKRLAQLIGESVVSNGVRR